MSDFRPSRRTTGYGCFENITSFRDVRKQPTASSSGTSTPLQSAPDIHTQEEQDTEMHDTEPHRESSPDPLDFLSAIQESDALIAELLAEIVNQGIFLSLEDAFEYALASKLQNSKSSEPTQWKNIKEHPDAHLWYAAALEEFNALLENGTFEPIKLPPNCKAIGCRWVFKLKRKPDGSVNRYKA